MLQMGISSFAIEGDSKIAGVRMSGNLPRWGGEERVVL